MLAPVDRRTEQGSQFLKDSFQRGLAHWNRLGLVRDAIIDQHFAERGRIGRLLGAVAQNPRVLGIGIDEDTAIVLEGCSFRVLGAGAVYVVDGSGVTHSNISEASPERTLSMHGVKLHVLSDGDGFDLTRRAPGNVAPRD